MRTEGIAGTGIGLVAGIVLTLGVTLAGLLSLVAATTVGAGVAVVVAYGVGERRYVAGVGPVLYAICGGVALSTATAPAPVAAAFLAVGTVGTAVFLFRVWFGNLKRAAALPVNAGTPRQLLATVARRLLTVRSGIRRATGVEVAGVRVGTLFLTGLWFGTLSGLFFLVETTPGPVIEGVSTAAYLLVLFVPFYLATDWPVLNGARDPGGRGFFDRLAAVPAAFVDQDRFGDPSPSATGGESAPATGGEPDDIVEDPVDVDDPDDTIAEPDPPEVMDPDDAGPPVAGGFDTDIDVLDAVERSTDEATAPTGESGDDDPADPETDDSTVPEADDLDDDPDVPEVDDGLLEELEATATGGTPPDRNDADAPDDSLDPANSPLVGDEEDVDDGSETDDSETDADEEDEVQVFDGSTSASDSVEETDQEQSRGPDDGSDEGSPDRPDGTEDDSPGGADREPDGVDDSVTADSGPSGPDPESVGDPGEDAPDQSPGAKTGEGDGSTPVTPRRSREDDSPPTVSNERTVESDDPVDGRPGAETGDDAVSEGESRPDETPDDRVPPGGSTASGSSGASGSAPESEEPADVGSADDAPADDEPGDEPPDVSPADDGAVDDEPVSDDPPTSDDDSVLDWFDSPFEPATNAGADDLDTGAGTGDDRSPGDGATNGNSTQSGDAPDASDTTGSDDGSPDWGTVTDGLGNVSGGGSSGDPADDPAPDDSDAGTGAGPGSTEDDGEGTEGDVPGDESPGETDDPATGDDDESDHAPLGVADRVSEILGKNDDE